MQLLYDDYEYRSWIMREYFLIDGLDNATVLSDEELDEFLFETRPDSYPCVALMAPSLNNPIVSDVHFIYREQVSDWACKMGLMVN